MTAVGTSCVMRLFLRVESSLGVNEVLMTIPDGLRPPRNVFCVVEISRASSGTSVYTHCDVTSDGYLMIPVVLDAGDMILVWGSWPVDVR